MLIISYFLLPMIGCATSVRYNNDHWYEKKEYTDCWGWSTVEYSTLSQAEDACNKAEFYCTMIRDYECDGGAYNICEGEGSVPDAATCVWIQRENMTTIVEIVKGNTDLSTLVTAIEETDLVDTLTGEGSFTVFAPNNKAFKKLDAEELEDLLQPENKDRLKKLLLRHVVPGNKKSTDIKDGKKKLTTVGGDEIEVSNEVGTIKIENKALVVKADSIASNGVVHIVDTVL